MRGMSIAVLALVLAGSVPSAQSQDVVVSSAQQLTRAGEHDAAIAMLRGALVSRPGDATVRRQLVSALGAKRADLMRQASEISREISDLSAPDRPATAVVTDASCDPAAVPVRIGGNIRTPMKTRDVKPAYPQLAQEGRVSGVVILEALIGCDGNVQSARVLRGQPLLNDAAVDAVMQWRYRPTLLNGNAIPVIMTVTVTFTLQD
jgi:TonB family protein